MQTLKHLFSGLCANSQGFRPGNDWQGKHGGHSSVPVPVDSVSLTITPDAEPPGKSETLFSIAHEMRLRL